MKLAAVPVLFCLAIAAPLLAAEPANLLAREALGGIKIGQSAAALEKVIGPAATKGKDTLMDAPASGCRTGITPRRA